MYDIDQPDLPALLTRFRALVDEYRGRMSVGELFVGTTEGAAALTTDRHLVFDWELLTRPWSAASFASAIRRRERAFGPDRWPTVVLSNHDQPRQASRLVASAGLPASDRDAVAKAAAVVLLTLRGTPFLYYGEEIGMGDVAIPPAESVDPPAARVGPDFPWWDRSQARTPLPWGDGPNGGFSASPPWLRLGDDVARRNVATQAADPDSVLSCYRRLLTARRTLRSLQEGRLRLVHVEDPTVLAFIRDDPGPASVVMVAFGRDGAEVAVPGRAGQPWRPVAGTHGDPPDRLVGGARVALRPFEGIVSVVEAG